MIKNMEEKIMPNKRTKKKLEVCSFMYTLLIYDIWMFCDMHKENFRIDCGSSIFDPKLTHESLYKKGVKIIRMSFPNTSNNELDSVYDIQKLKEFMNREMDSARGAHTVSPYRYGDCPLQVVSPLFLADIVRDSDRTTFEFYFVNNQSTYKKIRELSSIEYIDL